MEALGGREGTQGRDARPHPHRRKSRLLSPRLEGRFFFRDTTGKRRWGSAPNLKAAKVARAKLQTDVDRGEWFPTSTETFSEYADKWVKTYTGRTTRGIRQLTLDEYAVSLNRHAKPFFGQQRLNAINPPRIREFVKYLQSLQPSLSPNTIRNYVAPVRRLFATAHGDGLIRLDPCSGLKLATGDGMKAKFLTADQLKGIMSHAEGFGHLLIMFLAHTGLRISEALGLIWANVDLTSATPVLHVRQRRRGDDVDVPKSAASARPVPLSPDVVKGLAAHKLATRFSKDTDPVFATRAGSPIKPGNAARQYLKPAAKAAGVPDRLATFPVFRHTFSSVLHDAVARGDITIRQATDVAGHSDPAFFLRIYAHARELPNLDFVSDAIGTGSKKVAQ